MLKGQVALVTGAGSGLGKSIALRLAKEGAAVTINDVDSSKAESVFRKLKKVNQNVMACKADVSSSEEVDEMFSQIRERFGRLDILVNNSGIGARQPFLKVTEETWDKVLGVNLKGAFLCSLRAGKMMRKLGRGRIINISSIASDSLIHSEAAYAASKGGLNALTKAIAVDLGRYNITANAILPGVLNTGMGARMIHEAKIPVPKYIRTPKLGTGEDIAKLVVFLASDEASYFNGSLITVDGGDSIYRRYPQTHYQVYNAPSVADVNQSWKVYSINSCERKTDGFSREAYYDL